MRFISLIAFMVSIIAGGSTFLTPPESMPDKLSPILRNEAPVDSLMQYFRYINQAGRQIYRNNFLQASLCYDSAFLYNKHPFYVDVKNDILVNSKCGLFDRNTTFIRLLMKDKQIDTACLFAELPVRVFSPDNLQQIYALQKKYHARKKKLNPYQQAIHDMFVLDRAVKDFSLYEPGNPEKTKEIYRVRDSTDLENAKRFIQFCKKSGFPTEEKLGIAYKDDMLWPEVIHLLLWSFIRTSEQDAIMEIMKKECRNGHLHPAIYASLCGIYNENAKAPVPDYNFMNTTVILLRGTPYRPFVYYSDSLMQVVNTNRISIGLDSFHMAQKQVICEKFYKPAVGSRIIPMANYVSIEDFPYGIVKSAFDREGLEMNDYKINADKILLEAKCQEKCY